MQRLSEMVEERVAEQTEAPACQGGGGDNPSEEPTHKRQRQTESAPTEQGQGEPGSSNDHAQQSCNDETSAANKRSNKREQDPGMDETNIKRSRSQEESQKERTKRDRDETQEMEDTLRQ